MFRLSRAAEYSIRAILHLSMHSNENRVIDIDEIAKAQSIPPAYLAKLLQSLSRKGFVRSFKGQKGGFSLSKQPKEITLLDIIEAMEGPFYLNYCLIYEGYCKRDKICSVHDAWTEAQRILLEYLKGCNFEQLAISATEKQKVMSAAISL